MESTSKHNQVNVMKIFHIPKPPLVQQDVSSYQTDAPSSSAIAMPVDKDDAPNEQFESIIKLNVGGVEYTTSLNTLRKYPDSMLASMFSGRHHVLSDKQGRYFIDRDGLIFQHILNYLRTEALPTLNDAQAVYEEAEFFNIPPLLYSLRLTKPIAGFKLKHNFLNQVSNYFENIEQLILILQKEATQNHARISKTLVCIVKEDGPINPYENCIKPPVSAARETMTIKQCRKSHRCNVAVTFGPWRAQPDVLDLMDCIKKDFSDRGYELEQHCIGNCDQVLFDFFHCKRPIYEFKIKWW